MLLFRLGGLIYVPAICNTVALRASCSRALRCTHNYLLRCTDPLPFLSYTQAESEANLAQRERIRRLEREKQVAIQASLSLKAKLDAEQEAEAARAHDDRIRRLTREKQVAVQASVSLKSKLDAEQLLALRASGRMLSELEAARLASFAQMRDADTVLEAIDVGLKVRQGCSGSMQVHMCTIICVPCIGVGCRSRCSVEACM